MAHHNHDQFAQLAPWHPSWPIRWEEARGTYSEKACLLSIAAEENAINGSSDLFCAAYDAATATDPDKRAEFIAEFERLLDEEDDPRDQTWALDCDFLRDERSTWGMSA